MALNEMATATYYRNCVGKNFNSGIGKCPLNAGHVKAIILIEHGQILPATLTASSIEVACHAARPARIYPLKQIVEFAPEGGEAQTSENGYGGTKIVGYSAFNPTWTMADNDFNLRMNIVRAKGISFDAYFVDDNKVIYGKWNEYGEFAGVPLVGIAEGGNLFDTSSDTDSLTVQTYVKDFEDWMANIAIQQVDFDIVGALEGLVFVKFAAGSAFDKYKLVNVADELDVTAYYGQLIVDNAATALESGTSASYSATTNELTITGTPKLAAPSVLLAAGITGIEQW